MKLLNLDAIREHIRTFAFDGPHDAGGLMFGSGCAARLRRQCLADKALQTSVAKRCDDLLATSPDIVETDEKGKVTDFSGKALEARKMAEGYLLQGGPDRADWVKRRIQALFTVETWVAEVHWEHCPDFDHVVGNIGARVALAHDFLGDAYTTDETEGLAERLRGKFLLPYLAAVRERKAWWHRKELINDWKIMTNGEAGLAICRFAEHWPEAREALEHAVVGVVEILDAVQPQGDWHQGVNYWFGTLFFGLRYATALRRLTGGKVDLYQHWALKRTGDFAAMLTTPGKHAYNFEYNLDSMNAMAATAVAMLAVENKRRDWMFVARCFPSDDVLYMAFDDPDIPSEKPTMTEACYPDTGVAVMRSGWEDDAVYVGVKCSACFIPNKRLGDHLDQASFVIEAGGQWLAIDQGKWPYARYLGFFEPPHMYNFDSVSSVGHNTLLFDGIGQSYSEECPGNIRSFETGDGWNMVVMDASRCYPGLVTKFVRTLLFLKPECVIIRDAVECEGERHAEWLLNYPETGSTRREGVVSVVEHKGASMTIVPFLPSRKFGWQVNDLNRTSIFGDEETREEVVRTVRQLRFSPFRKADSFEFLFGLRVNGKHDGGDWRFEAGSDTWTLHAQGHDRTIRPQGDSLSVTE